MGYFNNFPYTNFHELNLDWLLQQMKQLNTDFANFAAENVLHYADPLDWDITKQYQSNTMVRNTQDNYIYLSLQPVPAGIDISNTDYWYRIGDLNAFAADLDAVKADVATRVKMTSEAPKIALCGDSSVLYMDDPEFIEKYFNGAQVTNYNQGLIGSVTWENIFSSQIANIPLNDPPDVIFLWCGGNDVPATTGSDWGGKMGAPDIADHTVSNNPQTVFEWIKYIINYLRQNFPEAQIINLLRGVNSNKPDSMWYYYAFYQTMIMHEWNVPVIHTGELSNFTMWLPVQKQLYTFDGSHWKENMYERVLGKISNAFQTGSPTTPGFVYPQVFFAPASVIDTNSTRLSNKNIQAITDWVCKHCVVPGSGATGGFLAGRAVANSTLGATYARFIGQIDNDSGTTQVMLATTGAYHRFTSATNGPTDYGDIIGTRTITSDNTTKWYSLAPSDYIVRNSGVSTLDLPADVATLMTTGGGNSLMQIRFSYDNDDDHYATHVIIYPALNANVIKGHRFISGGAEAFYKDTMTAV